MRRYSHFIRAFSRRTAGETGGNGRKKGAGKYTMIRIRDDTSGNRGFFQAEYDRVDLFGRDIFP
ncbi:MAG: hypothetical protein D3914_03270 [Candidatus Electrothrix sp. LOE2]|jgi:hypothetical protein|nr:hypothetical protein [Candidatus Electrothrix sp. LOE2]